jgi:hypothetical protein
VRKLDGRVLVPCCIIYFLAYLDRANMGFVNVLRAGKPSSFEETLHLKGADFNWVTMTMPRLLPLNTDNNLGRVCYLLHGYRPFDSLEPPDEEVFRKILFSGDYGPLGSNRHVHRSGSQQSRIACSSLLPRSA